MVIAATQAVTAHRPPADQAERSSLPTKMQHTQPITPGAPADVVLVLDRSESQSYQFGLLPEPYASKCNQSNINDVYACLNGGLLSDGTSITGCNNELVSDPNFPELTRGTCQPFRESKEAAYRFIQQLRSNTDRVALINFAESPIQVLSLTFNLTSAISAVNSMDVYVSRPDGADGHIPCNSSTPPEDFWKCGSSNIGGGLIQARDEFTSATRSAVDCHSHRRWSSQSYEP
jgi:hypothetical protein